MLTGIGQATRRATYVSLLQSADGSPPRFTVFSLKTTSLAYR
ncbi:MAG: hypothetical protein ACJAZO_001914 [Myxococcota bacterium]|jgi:hypothetical protein